MRQNYDRGGGGVGRGLKRKYDFRSIFYRATDGPEMFLCSQFTTQTTNTNNNKPTSNNNNNNQSVDICLYKTQ